VRSPFKKLFQRCEYSFQPEPDSIYFGRNSSFTFSGGVIHIISEPLLTSTGISSTGVPVQLIFRQVSWSTAESGTLIRSTSAAFQPVAQPNQPACADRDQYAGKTEERGGKRIFPAYAK
jgi:hypothetical protein